jgi:uncharacterized protein (UPF0216 family)
VIDFADQFVRMETENTQLREAARSLTDQLQEANRLATEAQKENVILKEELKQLKKKMKEEEQSKLKAQAQAQAQAYKKEGALCKSIENLLGTTPSPRLFLLSLWYFIFVMNCFS